MALTLTEFFPYQTDNLMLLMGTNPLPNFVAGKLLCRQEPLPGPSTRLHLLVSSAIRDANMHRTLVELLGGNPMDESQYLWVEPAHPEDVRTKVLDRVGRTGGTWSLHYTGGRKSMVVHAYRAMEKALEKREPAVFSYLDADSLELVIDPQVGGGLASRLPAHLKVPVSLGQLLELHGRPLSQQPVKEPFQPDFCRQLVTHLQDQAKLQEWLDWVHMLSTKTANNVPEWVPDIGGNTLSMVIGRWNTCLSFLWNWFKSEWLEHYVLAALNDIRQDVSIHDLGCSIKPKGLTDFEVDVAAMQGYRLFAVSATTDRGTSKRNELATAKLFEVLIRAQQMGGEEARAALVALCDHGKAANLENKVQEVWGRSSRVPVFGLHDLPYLPAKLKQWIKEAK